MASGLKIGDRVKVTRLHPLSAIDPPMKDYLGREGRITLVLPSEMGFQKMYRIAFNQPGPDPLAFLARELTKV